MPVVAATPGTACEKCPCHKAGIVVDGVPVCDLCDDDDGRHWANPNSPQPSPIFADDEVKPELSPKPERKEAKLITRKLYMSDVRREIQEAPPQETTSALAVRLGISNSRCYVLRKELNPAAAKQSRHFTSRFLKLAEGIASPVGEVEDTNQDAAQDDAQDSFDQAAEGSGCATITLTVTEPTLDAWWRRLAVEQKSEIFATNLEYSLASPGGDL